MGRLKPKAEIPNHLSYTYVVHLCTELANPGAYNPQAEQPKH